MATTYVNISKEELEEWLYSLAKRFTKDSHTAGVYLIHLSDVVGVKLSSTQTKGGISMGYADASMKLSLVSLVTGQTLNKKDADRSHFKRTLNWKKTWADGVEHWENVYTNAKGFYDAIAVIKDKEEYKENLLNKIESHPNWNTNDFIASMHQRLVEGGVLTTNQEQALMNSLNKIKAPATTRVAPVQQHTHTPPTSFTPEQEKVLARMNELINKAQTRSDSFTVDFTKSLITQAYKGIKWTDKQKQVLINKFKHYGV